MNGIQMMLGSMGIDIEAIKKEINPEVIKSTLTSLQNAAQKLDNIEASLLRIEIKLETIPDSDAMQLLINGAETAQKEAVDYVRNYNSGGNSNN